MIAYGLCGVMQAPKAQEVQAKPVCENCMNWTRKSAWRGKCSEKRADKTSPQTVQDYSCRFFEAQL